MFSQAIPFAVLASTALAGPISRRSEYHYTTAQSFSLCARVTKQCNSNIPDGLFVEGAHVGAGESVASLVEYNYTANQTGRVFYQNGTAEEISYLSGRVATTGGSPPFPYGWVQYENTTAQSPADNGLSYINGGIGTQGVGVAYPYTGVVYPGAFPQLYYRNYTSGTTYSSQFFACPSKIYGDIDIIAIGWRDDDGVTPEGCAEILLLPQCRGDIKGEAGVDSDYLQNTPCFTDANGANVTALMNGD